MQAPVKDRWTRAMEGASWVDMVVGVTVLLGGMLYATSMASLWSAAIVGSLVTILCLVEGWAESHGHQARVWLPASVNIAAGLWLIGFALVASVPAAYFWLTTVGGLTLVALEAFNLKVSFRFDQADATPHEPGNRA